MYWDGRSVFERDLDEETVLFCSYFPSYHDFQLLLCTDIRTIYHLGEVDDEKAVKLLNAGTNQEKETKSGDLSFQVIRLKMNEKML